ncbi:hypothetical protein Tco_0174029 [Tanacetum coccineum]
MLAHSSFKNLKLLSFSNAIDVVTRGILFAVQRTIYKMNVAYITGSYLIFTSSTLHDQLIQDNLKALKELETLHNKHTKRQEELDSTLKRCKDEFKEFERQNVKHREDLKHVKQKIQKMEEKTEKDTTKITENSADLIPKLEEDIPKLEKNSWTRIKFWKAP